MKKSIIYLGVVILSASLFLASCGPKPACGTKHQKAKKYKKLKSNPNFNM